MPTLDAPFNALGSAAHANQVAHVVGPLRDGARRLPLAIDAAGHLGPDTARREPLLLAMLRRDLGDETLVVRFRRDPAGADEALPPLRFAPWTEAGASLPAMVLPVDPTTRHAAPVRFALAAERLVAGAVVAIPTAQLAQWLDVELLEGTLGRLAFVMGAEQARLRRTLRELQHMRLLPTARGAALDRLGAAVSVPRLQDAPRWDVEAGEILTGPEDGGRPVQEPDDAYRHRLAIYLPRLHRSRPALLEAINGPGADDAPNAGLLARVGVDARVRLVEDDNPFVFAVHLVATGPDTQRLAFLAHLRAAWLIAPQQALEDDRFLSTTARARARALRTRLLRDWGFAAGQHVAPMLAEALDLVGRCRQALLGAGVPRLAVHRAQDDAGGSRYALGLGLDTDAPTAAQLGQLRAAVLDDDRVPGDDPAVEGIVQRLRAAGVPEAAADPDGAWLFQACGLRSVHRLASGHLYVSHITTGGLFVEGPDRLSAGASETLRARHPAHGDGSRHARLDEALAAAEARRAADGDAAWTRLDGAALAASWTAAIGDAGTGDTFARAGLPELDPVLHQAAPRLARVPAEMLVGLRLPAAQAQAVRDGSQAGVDALGRVREALAAAGFVACWPMRTGAGEIVLTCSIIGLPGVGTPLGPRRAAGFRWYSVPLQGEAPTVGALGSRTSVRAAATPGLAAIVCVGYARDPALTDPYECRVELPEGATLDLRQYEYLMNVLAHAHPAGVEVNTWTLRQRHVDLAGDGRASPIPPRIARAYRQFRRPRHRGELGVGLDE